MKKLLAIVGLMAVLVSCKEDEAAPEFTIDGFVQNVTERGVRDAEVRIYREGDDDPIEVLETDDGEFSINLAAGDYEIEVEADGYNTYSDDFTIEDDGEDLEITLEGDAVVVGQIINSQTGTGLAGATVAFSFDDDAESSEDADLVVTTGAGGSFTIEGAPVGEFVQIVESEGFFTRIVESVEFTDGPNQLANQTLVDQPEQGSVRVILTWGSSPSDLDSHLTGPLAAGGRFHMYFSNKAPANSGVSLDVDDTFSYGPETTTITTVRSGLYRYSVHNYSNQSTAGAAGIASSPAVVEIYDFNGLVERFVAPSAGSGDTWRVFEINVSGSNAQINAINTYHDAAGSSDTNVFRDGSKSQKFNSSDF